MCHSLSRPEAYNPIKKEMLTQVFSCEFYKFFKKAFFYRTPIENSSICGKDEY